MKNFFRVALSLGVLAGLVLLERKRPLRHERESKLRRDGRNLAVAALGALTAQLLEAPAVRPLARSVEKRNLGLLKKLNLPRPFEIIAAVVLMDYTLYLWHVATHRVPALWRFHVVHHADRDLTATTAVRFHFGELAISAAWRAAQVLTIGVTPLSLSVWQTFLFVSILFHHSNARLPYDVERRLVRFVVTPRMHGVHHSVLLDETDSNWSSGLAIWDRLHGTLRLGVSQDAVEIGAPDYDDPDVTLGRLLALPFKRRDPAPRASAPPRVSEAPRGRLLP